MSKKKESKKEEKKEVKTPLEVENEVKEHEEKMKKADDVLAPIKKEKERDLSDIEVEDPQVLRPKELPLVIKPAKGGSWKNDEQAEYAGTLNAYAYKNPEKWKRKKPALLQKLAEIGEKGSAINKYRGIPDNLNFNNKLNEA